MERVSTNNKGKIAVSGLSGDTDGIDYNIVTNKK
jgi:hypothetical protein